MPKAVANSQNPSSPGSPEAASVHERTSRRPPSSGEARNRQQSLKETVSNLEAACDSARKNGRARPVPLFESWPTELDDELKAVMLSTPGAGRQAISAIRASRPELPWDLIWSRIVYLGLTDRKRVPYYRKHEWTDEEDAILRNEYGSSRVSSRNAIEKILRLHPEWSRDAVVWRARVLGLTRHRTTPPQPWSSTLDHYLLSLMGCQLATIARRLRRSKKSVLARLRRLGWSSEFFGGFKTKDLVLDLRVSEDAVNGWVRLGWLERKKGRITEESLRWLCRHHAEEIPFQTLPSETQNWLILSMDYGRGAAIRYGGRRKRP